MLSLKSSVALSRAGLVAADGRCKFCDARADGMVRSEGVGMVVLKTLSHARRDGDAICAVILGSAINHVGGHSAHLMAPSGASQAELVRAACQNARVSAHDVQYVEAHGMGTMVGDPVEVEGLSKALQQGRRPEASLRIGSVKTNIGHAEAAGGIAGLIKVALALKHRLLPASLHFVTPNPNIAFDGIVVQSRTGPWPNDAVPLLAGVTSLGLTGINAHVVLGEAPPSSSPEDRLARTSPIVWPTVLSGKSEAALRAQAARLREHVVAHPELGLADLAYSLATTRSHFDHRAALVARDRDELVAGLAAVVPHAVKREAGKLAVLFTGQGAGTGRRLGTSGCGAAGAVRGDGGAGRGVAIDGDRARGGGGP